MSRVEVLVSSRDSLSVKFMEFTRIVSRQKGRAAVFFEGEDEKYFSVRINNIRPEISWVGVNCNGKQNVLNMRNKIRNHESYYGSFCIFFVDSDFDDNTVIEKYDDVYITPCYSIENLYISKDAFIRILSAEFGLSEVSANSDCFEKSVTFFEKCKSEYLNSISQFNFLIKEIRNMEARGELTNKVNINNVNFDKLIRIDFDSATKLYDESVPSAIFPNIPEDASLNLSKSKSYFSILDPEKWFRGKQHLEFFRLYLSQLKTDRCRQLGRQVFQEKGNVKLQLTKANCLSELSQYADTPNCLIDFIRNQHASALVS